MWPRHWHTELYQYPMSSCSGYASTANNVETTALERTFGKAREIRELISGSQNCGGENKSNAPVMLMGGDAENWEKIRRHLLLKEAVSLAWKTLI